MNFSQKAREGISEAWLSWIDRWMQASSYSTANRKTHYRSLLLVGRWLARQHPGVENPEAWTRDLAVSFVAAVDRLKVGDWAYFHYKQKDGLAVSPYTKDRYIAVVRNFFTDLQEWGWISRRFDPLICFAVPRSIRGLLGPEAKPIDAFIWKKLLIAALQLRAEDLPSKQAWHYPFAFVKALAAVWLFSGLRPDEIRRLPLGCVRYAPESSEPLCWLDVPANKLNPAYSKPVDPVLGTLVQAWEKLRPLTPPRMDAKSGQLVHYLFATARKHLSEHYLERSLIPLLCRLAGVPESDSYGRITPNRARHTIAYQLANGRDPMSLLELQTWMGHRSPNSTMHYSSRKALELSQVIEQNSRQNTRLVEVLIDREAVSKGAAQRGEAWKYYDLGHGFCTHIFFETCPHRIACAGCASYLPKDLTKPQLQEAQGNLLKLREAIPLTDAMLAAIDAGMDALAHLLEQLADTPTPSGETPRQLGTVQQLNLIALKDIPIRPADA